MKHLVAAAVMSLGLAGLAPAHAATVRWFGQSCFEVTSASGKRLVLDPFDASIGYLVPSVSANVVLITHEHYDHNNAAAVKGEPDVLHGLKMGPAMVKPAGIPVRAVRTSHGDKRGENTVFVFSVDGVTFAHAGDLGVQLTPAQVKEIGPVDVLMVPVGSVYTIDGAGAAQVVKALKPRLVIPMHYKTPDLKIPLEGPDKFLAAAKAAGWPVKHAGKPSVSVTKAGLPKQTTVEVLEYK